jgi:predicted O-methyltransferase YrrM
MSGAEYTADWFSHNIPVWQAVVVPHLSCERLRWLELGSYEGRSALWTLDNALTDPEDELVCVDMWWRPEVEARFDANVGSRAKKVKKYIRNAMLDMIANGERYDCVYVDGDHDGAATMEHGVLAWMLLKTGGILIFDDYEYAHPSQDSIGKTPTRDGIDGFLSGYATRLTVMHKAYQVIVRKRA